jgi:hypothetical protein
MRLGVSAAVRRPTASLRIDHAQQLHYIPAMSLTKQFIENHKKILAASPCMLNRVNAPTDTEAFNITQIGEVFIFQPKADLIRKHFGVDIGSPDPTSSLQVGTRRVGGIHRSVSGSLRGEAQGINIITVKANEGVQYLPWQPNSISFMKLDNAKDKVFFTGPLEGCFVYAAKTGYQWYLFHANYNKNSKEQENVDAKEKMYILAKTGIFNTFPIVDVGCLGPKQYKPADNPAYRAFVYGIQEGDNWQFYFHSIAMNKEGEWTITNASRVWASLDD